MRHVLLISGYPPSTQNGGGIILRNLLLEYDHKSLSILTSRPVLDRFKNTSEPSGLLPVPHIGVPSLQTEIRGLRRLCRSLNVLLIPLIVYRGYRALRKNSTIVAVPWGGEMGSELFASAYFVHLLTGKPLVVYEMDEWGATLEKSGRVARLLERLLHARILRASNRIYVVSKSMHDLFRSRFGVIPEVLAHSIRVSKYNGGRVGNRANLDRCDVLFIGNIYGAQLDSIVGTLRVIQNYTFNQQFRLVIYSNSDTSELERMGLRGKNIEIRPAIPPESIPQIFATADILLLPFSFLEDQRKIVSTSFPTKIADYLASGVPILVHAPTYSTIAQEATAGAWGEVVESQDESAMAAALDRLARNLELRKRLVLNALSEAREHFDIDKNQLRFQNAIEGITRCADVKIST